MSVRIYGFSVGLFAFACSASPREGGAGSGVVAGASTDEAVVTQAATARTKPKRVLSVSSGGEHTCAVLAHGETRCWGINGNGEMGNGLMDSSTVYGPTNAVSNFPTAKAMSAGSSYTCGLSLDGLVECWGANFGGVLGIGDTVTWQLTPAPVTVPALVKKLYTNNVGSHTCAIVEGGVAYCWGTNFDGQLGIAGPSTSTPTSPVPISRRVKRLALGSNYTCAVLGNGQVTCWGVDPGTGTAVAPGSTVSLPAPATDVSSGMIHVCATLETGDVYCWGNNYDGEVGIGSTDFTVRTPSKVGLLGPAASVDCGSDDTCAVLTDGRVQCWGNNGTGQLGTGDGVLSYNSPQLIDVGFPVESISSGFFHRCALSTTGDLKCWGYNGSNMLGLSCGASCPDTFMLTPAQLDNIQF